jgi:anti-sigma regulatory factor (Ser/Thr protein kinase)
MIPATALDDVAIAAFRFTANEHVMRWSAHTERPQSVRAARAAITAQLHAAGFRPPAIHNAEIILAELTANVVRYAHGAFDLALDCNHQRAVVLHVLDRGPGFHHDRVYRRTSSRRTDVAYFIVTTLGSDFTIEKRIGGGSHARVVLPRTADAIEP